MADWRAFTWPFGDHHEEERLSALLDDELDVDEALTVTRHVSSCSRCLGELDSIREARLALRGLPAVDPPVDVYTDVLARPPASTGAGHDGRFLRLASAALASGALVAAAAFLAGDDDSGTVAPPVDVFVVDHVARTDGGPMLTPLNFGR